MIRCEFVDPLLEPQWNAWLQEFPEATFFHTCEWARVLAHSYHYPLRYAVKKSGAQVCAILPLADVRSWWTGHRGVSLPFSDECAPLLATGESLDPLLDTVKTFGRQQHWDYLELRGGAGSLAGAVQSDEFLSHTIPLDSSESLQFARLKESHQRNIRKAQRERVEIHTLRTSQAMEVYYGLHCLTRRRHGLPPQPPQFFRFIQEIIITPGHGLLALARCGDQWIAGAVYFEFGTKALYKFGASNLAFQHLRSNNLLMWNAILHFREKGLREFSLGRTDLNDTGLLQFKRGWGGNEFGAPS